MKTKCVKIECAQCHVIGTCQIFFGRDGKARYGRVRHYLRLVDGKSKFEYHVQGLKYISEKAKELCFLDGENCSTIAPSKIPYCNDDLGHRYNDHENFENAFFVKVEPRAGFGPATITLPR